jgi:endonuclease-8
MEGSWHLYRHGSSWRRPAFQARAVLETAQWVAVGFELGLLEIMPIEREAELLDYLGPDLLGPDWDAAEAVRRLAADPARPIAVALGDQRNLAGLGNEYVNELCFLRGVLPTRPVGEVPDLPGLVGLAHRLITANRERVRTTTGNTRPGERAWVFGRDGQPCRRCGTRIERGRLGRNDLELRNTFWCPRCQT